MVRKPAEVEEEIQITDKIAPIDWNTMGSKADWRTQAIRSMNRQVYGYQFRYKDPLNVAPKMTEEQRRAQEMDELDEKYGLPETFHRYEQSRTKTDTCHICQIEFHQALGFIGIGDRDFSCKRCGFSVCQHCSSNKRFLSKNATEKLRVCDLCDTKLDNTKLLNQFEKFQELKDQKATIMKEVIHLRKEHNIKEEAKNEELKLYYADKLVKTQQKLEEEKVNEQNFLKSIADLQQQLKEFE